MLRASVIAAAVAISNGCAPRVPIAQPVDQEAVEATQAAFESLITQNGSGVAVGVYCLSLASLHSSRPDRADPSPAVVSGLASAHANLRPRSGCSVHDDSGFGRRFQEETTRKQVMFLQLFVPPRTSADTLIYWGSYSCGDLCGGAGPLRVWRRDGKWQALFTVEVVS